MIFTFQIFTKYLHRNVKMLKLYLLTRSSLRSFVVVVVFSLPVLSQQLAQFCYTFFRCSAVVSFVFFSLSFIAVCFSACCVDVTCSLAIIICGIVISLSGMKILFQRFAIFCCCCCLYVFRYRSRAFKHLIFSAACAARHQQMQA